MICAICFFAKGRTWKRLLQDKTLQIEELNRHKHHVRVTHLISYNYKNEAVYIILLAFAVG